MTGEGISVGFELHRHQGSPDSFLTIEIVSGDIHVGIHAITRNELLKNSLLVGDFDFWICIAELGCIFALCLKIEHAGVTFRNRNLVIAAFQRNTVRRAHNDSSRLPEHRSSNLADCFADFSQARIRRLEKESSLIAGLTIEVLARRIKSRVRQTGVSNENAYIFIIGHFGLLCRIL